jgi:hypothetical protein
MQAAACLLHGEGLSGGAGGSLLEKINIARVGRQPVS